MASPREEALRRIEKKRSEILSLEMQIREASSYIQALEDILKLLPKDAVVIGDADKTAGHSLRAGTVVARVREVILDAGKPLHINEILGALGKSTDNTSRAAVSGSISGYFRRGEVFTRPAPNTFGLIELPIRQSVPSASKMPENQDVNPPENFGLDLEAEENASIFDEDLLDDAQANS